MKSVSIVIPTLNEELYIKNTLDAVLNQNLKPIEIFVIDAGSTDNTQKLVKEYKNVNLVISEPPVGNQRDLGAKKAVGDLVIFLDADTIIKKHFIQKVVNSYEKSPFSVACPYYFPYKSRLDIQIFFIFLNLIFFIVQKFLPSGGGSCMIFDNKILHKKQVINPELKFEDLAAIRNAAKYGKFKIINTFVYTSDRRFKRHGVYKTMLKYLLLSIVLNIFPIKWANILSYKFDDYKR